MREAFVHDAVLDMAAGEDVRAPGAAITVALCGHWEHEPPCSLAPHHTQAERDGAAVRTRTLFATEPEREQEVRDLIDRALAHGSLHRPDGIATGWQLRTSRPGVIAADERDQTERLIAS